MGQYLVLLSQHLCVVRVPDGAELCCAGCRAALPGEVIQSFAPGEPEPVIDEELAFELFGVNVEDNPPWRFSCPSCASAAGEIVALADEDSGV